MRVDFFIWGCGRRGKKIYQFMKGAGVRGFIDANPNLQGTSHQGVPIISFGTFLENHRGCIVIVTPFMGAAEIEQRLRQHEIPYLSARELPQEIVLDGIENLLDIADKRIRREGTAYLYGLNLFSICLLNYYADKPDCKVKIVPESGVDHQLVRKLERQYPTCISSLAEVKENRLYLTSDQYDPRGLPEKGRVNLYDFMGWIPEHQNPKIKALKNIHKGKRCFIVGTGPSLRIEDLDKLARFHEICISVSGIVRAYDSTQWRPDYYLCQYGYGFKEWKAALLKDGGTKHMLIPDICLEDEDNPAFVKFHLSVLNIWEPYPPGFSNDFSQGAYVGGDVIYTCIQLAAYLGCSEIYLYGVDHSYSASKKYNHFRNDYLSDERGDPTVNSEVVERESIDTKISLAYAREVGKERGFSIYNASRKTLLNVFEKINFDLLFD